MYHDDEIFNLATRLPLFLPMFALVLFRISGLMIAAPVFGSQTVPVRVRVALAMVMALTVFPVVAPGLPRDLTMGSAIFGVFGELLIGITIGLSLNLLFAGIQLAGMIIGQQAGLALGQSYNPVLNSETTLLGQLFILVALTVFVIVGGHRELVRTVLDTFSTIPVMSFRFDVSIMDLITGLLTSAYAIGLRLAAPVLITLLITTLVLGFLSRTIPQLNILSVGFVIRAVVALGAAGITLAASESLMTESMTDVIERVRLTFGLG